jgi:uncharacterized OB-fold protein
VSGEAPATLAASWCRSCGLVSFPVERYGCERCGALPSDHEPLDLPALGRVASFAEVHRHHDPRPSTPFVVAAVEVDGGPVLKAVLVGPEDVGAPSRLSAGPAGEVMLGERVSGRFEADGGFRWVRQPPGETGGSGTDGP